MSAPSDHLHDLIVAITPIDRSMERFRAGGDACAREIERLFETLTDIEGEVSALEAMLGSLDADVGDEL